MVDMYLRVLLIIGLYLMLSKMFDFMKLAYGKFLVREKNLLKRYGAGSWVVITGAAEGIGKSFAMEFARRNFNVALIDKQRDLLKETAAEIKEKFPNVQEKYIIADFTRSYDKNFFEPIMKNLEDLDISVLVNNVGVASSKPLEEESEDKMKEIMMVNMFSPVMMTRKLIERLQNRKNRSAIITISSHHSFTECPEFITYASTKAFLTFFNQAMITEMGHKNIDFLAVCPGAVITRMTKFMEKCYQSCTADECAQSSLKNLGNTSWTYGHWKHEIFMGLVTNSSICKKILIGDVKRRMAMAEKRMEKEEQEGNKAKVD